MPLHPTVTVALLAEGVDRNHTYMPDMIDLMASPSSRRAWIEISLETNLDNTQMVALLAEGVDRNRYDPAKYEARVRRPPRGGRG